MLGLVVFLGFGKFNSLLKEFLPETGVEVGHRSRARVQRFDSLGAIMNLSSRPVSVCQPSQRAAADENHHNKNESSQRTVKRAAIAKAVEAALHKKDDRTNILSRANNGDRTGRRTAAPPITNIAEECLFRNTSCLWLSSREAIPSRSLRTLPPRATLLMSGKNEDHVWQERSAWWPWATRITSLEQLTAIFVTGCTRLLRSRGWWQVSCCRYSGVRVPSRST